MPPSKKKIINYSEISELFSTGLKQAIGRPTIYGYVPHAKQIKFHSATEKGRLYVGGNRAGKTVGGVVEDVWWLTGKHPYQSTPPPPVRGRIVTVDFKQGFEKIINPEIIKWLPPSELINGSREDSFDNNKKTLTLANGSFVEFMSYEQDVLKFAGTSRHFTHFDEEPPKAIYTECLMRLMDTKGHWWMTMTPLDGMASFVYDDIYLVGMKPGSNIAVIGVDVSENPYIDPAEIENVMAGVTDEDEKKARKSGKFVQLGGLAFKSFRPDVHVVNSFIPPEEWTLYASMDHGFNNPTAWLFHSVSPSGIVITWDEVYDRELTVPEWAARLHEINKQSGRRVPDIYVGDPAIKQRSAHKGTSIQTDYAVKGIPIVLANNDVLIGVNKMNDYLKSAKWFVTGNCVNLIKQLQRGRWKTWATQKMRDQNNPQEQLHKYNDHATDSARYFFSFLPPIKAVDLGPNLKQIAKQRVEEIIRPVASIPAGGYSIDRIVKQYKVTEWTQVDEYMGGNY